MNASDGASGLAAIREHRPKAVLLDIMMPGEIDGLDVLRIVKSDPELKETFVALVTSRGQKADYQLGIDLGADAYFVKPFSPLKVAAWMRERIS